MAYGWDPYIANIITNNVVKGYINVLTVSVENATSFIVRQKGNIFYVASNDITNILTQVSVVHNDAIIKIKDIIFDSTNMYFNINVEMGSDMVIIETTLKNSAGIVTTQNMITTLYGLLPIPQIIPPSLLVLKPLKLELIPNVGTSLGSYHLYFPNTVIGSRVISYVSFLDGNYLYEGIINGVCYYCYKSSTKIYINLDTTRIQANSIFTVKVTDDQSKSYTFTYSAAILLYPNTMWSAMTPVSVKLRQSRLIVQMPVELYKSRPISVEVILGTARNFISLGYGTNTQVCYNCNYFKSGLDINRVNIANGIDVISSSVSITSYPYIVSDILPPVLSTYQNVTIIIRENLDNLVLVRNISINSLLQEEGNRTSSPITSPTSFKPTVVPTSKPTSTSRPSTSYPSLTPVVPPTMKPTVTPTSLPTSNELSIFLNLYVSILFLFIKLMWSLYILACWKTHVSTFNVPAVLVASKPYCTSCTTLDLWLIL